MRKSVLGPIPALLKCFTCTWVGYYPAVILLSLYYPLSSFLNGFLLGGLMSSAQALQMAPLLRVLPLYLTGIAGVALVSSLLRRMRAVSIERGNMSLRETLLEHILRLPVASQNRTHSGNYLAQFTMDSEAAISAVDQTLTILTTLLIGNLSQIGYIFVQSPALGWTTIGVALMSLVFNGGFAPYMRKLTREQRHRMAEMSEKLSDLLNGHTLVRSDNQSAFFVGRTMKALNEVFLIGWKIKKTDIVASTPAELSKFLIDGIILSTGIILFNRGQMPMEQVMICWSMGVSIGFSMRGLARNYLNLQEKLASADRVTALLKEPLESQGAITEVTPDQDAAVFENVRFSYKADTTLFDGLNIAFPKGSRTALVGSSGGGKSTLGLLLMRFYDPDSGMIKLFGRDVKTYTLDTLRSQIAYVPQNPHLFDDTLWENIARGKPNATDEEIRNAAQLAQVDAFLSDLPDGYRSRVGENGSLLSGGQRQRVAIARALLKDAPILLLDEATASLDNRFESDIQKVIAALPKEKTIITIVHRLNTAIGSDRICVLEQGNVVEAGTHEDLLKKNGRYADLWSAQLDSVPENEAIA